MPETHGLDAWLEKFNDIEMPVLANVVTELKELTSDTETSVDELTQVILKDATLTSQVLRISNSVQYNPAQYPITTISRAIVLIGYQEIRAICVTVMVIDSLLGKKPRERLLEVLAKAFHAAVQARNIARGMNKHVREEVFIAALLLHLGEMAFWGSGGDEAESFDELLNEPGADMKNIADKILGFSFTTLTKNLGRNWGLGDLLIQALEPPQDISPKVQSVLLGEEISKTAKYGWQSPEMMEVMLKVAKFTGKSPEQVKKLVYDSVREVRHVAKTYGASRISHLLPSTSQSAMEFQAERDRQIKADKTIQQAMMDDLRAMLTDKVDVNTIFQTVLEGVHRGLGLERVIIALYNPERTGIEARYLAGADAGKLQDAFRFAVGKAQQNIFSHVLTVGECFWMGHKNTANIAFLSNQDFIRVLNMGVYFIGPIIIGKRPIGIIYGDCRISGRGLRQEQFDGFKLFVERASLCLSALVN